MVKFIINHRLTLIVNLLLFSKSVFNDTHSTNTSLGTLEILLSTKFNILSFFKPTNSLGISLKEDEILYKQFTT